MTFDFHAAVLAGTRSGPHQILHGVGFGEMLGVSTAALPQVSAPPAPWAPRRPRRSAHRERPLDVR
jgi:hypothetical protein